MKRLSLSAVFILMVFLGPGTSLMAAECGREVSPVVLAGDLSFVLFDVSGSLDESEARALNAQGIKMDIRSALNEAGIQSEIIDSKDAITGNRFLKVHIYSILLERQVYFCSVAVMQHHPSGDEACKVKEYSNVTSQISNIRPQIREMMTELLGDIR